MKNYVFEKNVFESLETLETTKMWDATPRNIWGNYCFPSKTNCYPSITPTLNGFTKPD